jgi:hypothetical protein
VGRGRQRADDRAARIAALEAARRSARVPVAPPARGDVVGPPEPMPAPAEPSPPAPLEELVRVPAPALPEPVPAPPAPPPLPGGGPFGPPVHTPARTVVPVEHDGVPTGWIEVDDRGSRFVPIPAPPRDPMRAALAGAAIALGGAALGALATARRRRRR